MEKVFDEVNSLDKRCYEYYGLSEDILMEHASSSMLRVIEKKFEKNSKVLIVSGAGNNGADGIALARLLQGKYDVTLFLPFGAKSSMAKLQLKRLELLDVDLTISYNLKDTYYDVVVDCLFGSGLNRELDSASVKIIEQLNSMDGFKLSCDIPSGIDKDGKIQSTAFKSDSTITMGALKKSLYSDSAKEYVGEISVANLGVQRVNYEIDSDCYLLQSSDLKLPNRVSQNTHKGSFGHLSVVVGEKSGAGIISSMAGFSFGAGLVTAITQNQNLPFHIMQSQTLPSNTTAIAIGMGLGKQYDKTLLQNDIPKLFDADMFYDTDILNFLDKDNIVLTPHPKEFANLLSITSTANIDVKTLQKDRFYYLNMFCQKYPKVVVVLKGANTLIGLDEQIYINPLGSSKLSFGGSGDVLSGLIASLMAQGYSCLEASISGTLAHSIASQNYSKNDYALNPEDLIKEIEKL